MTEPSIPMRLALDAARAVRGTTSPNPWVGAVVTREGEVISTGATAPQHRGESGMNGNDRYMAECRDLESLFAPYVDGHAQPGALQVEP